MDKYKITNTTRKPTRLDKEGKDLRRVAERVGHAFSFPSEPDGGGKIVMVLPGHFAVSTYVNEELMEAEHKGIINIEQIKDMGSILETYRSQKREVLVQEDQSQPKIKASPMGDPVVPQRSGIEMDGAVNPDGDPNFIVRAPSSQKSKELNAPRTG